MTFTHDAWAAIAPLRAAIDELPLLTQLRDGSLPREAFIEYLTQDALYLDSYARTLALAASQARDGEEISLGPSTRTPRSSSRRRCTPVSASTRPPGRPRSASPTRPI